MKIYTITCNNAYNYGAVLQAYALQRFLELNGHEVEIIDYYPSNLRKISDKYKKNPLAKLARIILYYPDYHRSQKTFGSFSKKYLHLTVPCYKVEDIERLPKADLYIAGSDQIWNTRMKNAEEGAYFLELKRDIKRISYAASVGMITIDNEQMQALVNKLQAFDAVSIREKITNEQLNEHGIPSECVIDPVFLLDTDTWKKDFEIQEKSDKYVFVYALHHIQAIYEYAKQLAKNIKGKVYVVSVEIKEIRRGNDRFFWNPAVPEFLSLISNAEAVVTNSFHGVSLGCIFNKPVHIFDTEDDDPRISNIVEVLKLHNRICDTKLTSCLENAVNSDTNICILEESRKGKTWLLDRINEIQNEH